MGHPAASAASPQTEAPVPRRRHRLATRLFALFVLCGVVPLAVQTWESYSRVAEGLETHARSELRLEAKHVEYVLTSRLRDLERELRRMLGAQSGGGPARLPELVEDPAFSGFRHVETFESLEALRRDWPAMRTEERDWLASGHCVLRPVPRPGGSALVQMIQRLGTGPEPDYAAFEIRPGLLWDSDLFEGQDAFVAVFSQSGLLLHGSGVAAGASPVTEELELSHPRLVSLALGGEPYVAASRLLFLDPAFRSNWFVVAGRAESQVYAGLEAFSWRFAWLTFSVLGLIVLLSATQIRRSLRPIGVLRSAAERLGQGELAVRAEIRSGDEFEQLGATFDRMAAELQRAFVAQEQSAKELASARDAALAAAETEKRFVANVSHELRTPLTSIRSYTELLLLYDDIGQEERSEFLRIVQSEAERLARLLEDLLCFARIEHDLMAAAEHVDLGSSLRVACELLAVQALAKGCTLELAAVPSESVVLGVPDRLLQVWTNLLGNAVKFSPGSEIRIAVTRDATEAIVAFADRGPGIPREQLERIFERFHQVTDDHVTNKPAGSGLGLAIVKEIVELHAGRVRVESELGQGTTFFVHLPLEDSRAGVPDPGSAPQAVATDPCTESLPVR